MKTTETTVGDTDGFSCWDCKMSDLSYGYYEDSVHCNHYKRTFYQKHKENSFSIPIVDNKPDFCKVKNIIVEEE